MTTKFYIADKETGEKIRNENRSMKLFDTIKEAQIFCEENGIDYDYWEIREMII